MTQTQPQNQARETKHDKFIRLATKRLQRTLEEFRMLSQLASANYENTIGEAHELVQHLDGGLKTVANAFGVQYRSIIGSSRKDATKRIGPVNEIDIARAISFIETSQPELAIKQLKAALNQEAR